MNRRTLFGIIFVVAALLKLGDMWGIINLDWLWQHPLSAYFGPLLILYIGIELIISRYEHYRGQWLQRPVPFGDEGKRICCSASFGADEYIFRGEPFRGARLDAFFGGIRLDLREAIISEDEEIDIHTFMGGVELLVPKNINVIVKSHSFIGGVGNETTTNMEKDAHCIHVSASNILGGVNIKNKD